MILYYTIYGLYLLIAILFSYVVQIAPELLIDPQSVLGQVLQYIVIFYLVAAIPGSLYFLRKRPLLQMSIIAIGGFAALFLFYWMGHYHSMLYLSGMAMLSHLFCKNNLLEQQQEQSEHTNL